MKNVIGFIIRLPDKMTVVGGHFGGLLVLLMAFLVLYEVILRYVFNNAPLIADEISGYMLVAIVFLGLSYRWREGGHVRVEALVSKLPEKVSSWLRLVTMIVSLIFVVIATVGSLELVGRSINQNATSDSWSRIPLQWPQLFVPIGFSLLALYIVFCIGQHIAKLMGNKDMGGRLPSE